MTFLNPLILGGLFAISIPILIHLLNLSKVRKVEFSTLRFLKELQKSKMRRIKLRQLLLLALRILTIIFLVFAFADPVLRSSSGNYAGKSSTIIILDNSYSMSAQDNRIFENAKSAARELLTVIDPDGEVYFILSSDLGNEAVQLVSRNSKNIISLIDSSEISLKPLSINEALVNATLLFSNSAYSVNDLFIISDQQLSNFSGGGFRESAENEGMSIYLVSAGQNNLYNISLDSADVESGFVESGMENKVGAFINNRSPYSQKSRNIRLNINGKYFGESFADVGSFEKQIVEQSFLVANAGNYSLELQLDRVSMEDDQVLQDNRAYFTASVPSSVKVALIGERTDETRFPELAMQAAENVTGSNEIESKKYYDIRMSTGIDESVNECDVIILSGKNDLSDKEADLLNEFVTNGGGLLFFPGNSLNIQSVNDKLLSRSGGLRIGSKVTLDNAQLNPKFGAIDYEHPLLNGIFRNKALSVTSVTGGVEAPRVNEYYKTILSENGKSVMVFDNNDPFLSELRLGKGTMLVSSLSLSTSASDLSSKSIFVPLLIRAVNYLSGNFSTSDEYYVGGRNIVRLSGLKNVKTLTNPAGMTDTLGVSFGESSEKYLIFPYNNFSASSGFYKATDSSGNEQLFALNPNPVESDLAIMDEDDAREFLQAKGYSKVYTLPWNDAGSAYAGTKQGTQLWKYFLSLALLALAAEKLLSRKLEKGE